MRRAWLSTALCLAVFCCALRAPMPLSAAPLLPQDAATSVSPRLARISGGVMAGQCLSKVPPVYPAEARASGVQGAVVLHVIVGAEGRVQQVTAISGPEVLRQPAIDAVSQWVYKPFLLNGQPTGVDTTVVVNFTLGS